jgi:YNFM family putative membrane transporter
MWLSLAAFASAASTRLCDPMLPDLARSFGGTPSETAHVVSGYAMAYGLLQVCFGPLGDRIGKYRLIALTTLLTTLGCLVSALAGSLDGLIVGRVLTGVTAAGVIPLAMAWIGDTVPYEERQPTLARFLIGQVLGVVGGQFIGGVFADTLGWRSAFAFMAALYALIGAAVLLESRSNPITHHAPLPNAAPTGILGQAATVLSAPWARTILWVVFAEGALIFGALAFVPSYIHTRFGLSLTASGALMAFFGLGGLSYVMFAKHFVRRFGEVGLALMGGFAIASACLMLIVAPSAIWAALACYLSGLGYYAMHNTLQTNATQMAPTVRGTAVSLFASSFFVGQSLGVSMAAFGIERFGTQTPFWLSAALLPLLSLVFAAALRRHHRR